MIVEAFDRRLTMPVEELARAMKAMKRVCRHYVPNACAKRS